MNDKLVEEGAIDVSNNAWVALGTNLVMFILSLIPDVVVREFVIVFAIVLDDFKRGLLLLATFIWL